MKWGLFVILSILIVACGKYYIPKSEVPVAIKNKIKTFKSNACIGAEVSSFTLHNRTVYSFYNGCDQHADNATFIYDSEGKEVCTIGGIGGFVLCEGVRLDTVASNPIVIWKK